MLMADVIMLVHFSFVAFVVGGQCLIMVGYHRKWRWAANRLLTGVHLACVLYVVVQAWAGRWCPLTLLENRYREAAGEEGYQTTFIRYWVGRVMYYDAPQWVFILIYTLFGLLAFVYWFLQERRRVRCSD
jgi:hypothetical protein